MSELAAVIALLRDLCDKYEHAPVAVFRRQGDHSWPLTAANEAELEQKLSDGGHLLALPKEPAALANVIEVSLVDYLAMAAEKLAGVTLTRGTERGYPDLELSGSAFKNKYYAVDIKAARRRTSEKGVVSKTKTQSRITLYTGNTYFKFPQLHWPNTFRPFEDYQAHLDIIAIYTLNQDSASRIQDLEFIVQEAWRIGSKQRSSTTREYIGAVDDINRLREGKGEFETIEAFYKYWRAFNFKIGASVAKQLSKLLDEREKNKGTA